MKFIEKYSEEQAFCSSRNLLFSSYQQQIHLQLIHVPLVGCGLYRPSTMSCSLMRCPLTRGPSSGGVSKICKKNSHKKKTKTTIFRGRLKILSIYQFRSGEITPFHIKRSLRSVEHIKSFPGRAYKLLRTINPS